MGDHNEQPAIDADDADDGIEARLAALADDDRRLVYELIDRLSAD